MTPQQMEKLRLINADLMAYDGLARAARELALVIENARWTNGQLVLKDQPEWREFQRMLKDAPK